MYPLVYLAPLDLTVRSHTLLLVVAIAVCCLVAAPWGRRLEGISPRRTLFAVMLLAVPAVGGAHLHLALRQWREFAREPVRFIRVWEGMHAAGAVIGLVFFFPLAARAARVPAGKLADALAPTIALGTAIARIGCLLYGCCHGTPCAHPWCLTFPGRARAVHPLQLYFVGAGVVTMAVALGAHRWKRFDGEAALAAAVVFSLLAAALEPFRGELVDRVHWGPLPELTWLALGLAAFFAILWLNAATNAKSARQLSRTALPPDDTSGATTRR